MEKFDTSSNLSNSIKRTFRLKNLTDKQKSQLTNGGLGLGGLFTGAALFGIMNKVEAKPTESEVVIDSDEMDCVDNEDVVMEEAIEVNSTETSDLVLELDIPVSETDFTSMSFEDAFAEARREMGSAGAFQWKGEVYNTYYKEEWDDLSQDQQEEFLATIQDKSIQISDKVNEIYIDQDNDGNPEVVLTEINGEAIVKEVDLNDDGNIDVIHNNSQLSNEDIVSISAASSEDTILDLKIQDKGIEAQLSYTETDDKVKVDIEAEIDKNSPYMKDFAKGLRGNNIPEALPEIEPIGNALPEFFEAELINDSSSDLEILEDQNALTDELEIIVVDQGIEDLDLEIVKEDPEVLDMDQITIIDEETIEGSEIEEEFESLSDLFDDNEAMDLGTDNI